MNKDVKRTLTVTSMITLLPIILGILLWNQIPDVVPTHFGADGKPNGFSDKVIFVFVIPMILAALQIGMGYISYRRDTKAKKHNIAYTAVLWIIPINAVGMFAMIYTYLSGANIDIGACTMLMLGIIYMFLGNYMPKWKQNNYWGVRTKPTMESEENWKATHRVAGFLWVIAGAVIVINAFLKIAMTPVFIVVMTVACIIPIIYSYIGC